MLEYKIYVVCVRGYKNTSNNVSFSRNAPFFPFLFSSRRSINDDVRIKSTSANNVIRPRMQIRRTLMAAKWQ